MRQKFTVISTVSLILLAVLLVPVAVGLDNTGTKGESDQIVEKDKIQIDETTNDREVDLVVKLKDKAGTDSPRALQAQAEQTQPDVVNHIRTNEAIELKNQFWLINAVTVSVDMGVANIQELRQQRYVEDVYVAPEVKLMSGTQKPEAPFNIGASNNVVSQSSNYTYGVEQVNAPDVWKNHDKQGEGVRVSVIDSGVNETHQDIPKVVEWSHFDADGNRIFSNPFDDNGHGTHVAGTVVGPKDPQGDVPTYGVAPEAELLASKVVNENGSGTFDQVISGMQWSIKQDADILQMSLGINRNQEVFIDAVENAENSGAIVVAASGNFGTGYSGSPANIYDSVAVGATTEGEGIAGFTSGETIDTDKKWGDNALDHWPEEYVVPTVSAPGRDVLSSTPGDEYGYLSGTSMASPHVSGVIALGLSNTDVELTVNEIEDILEQTTHQPVGSGLKLGERDNQYGAGIVDAEAFTNAVTDDVIRIPTTQAPESVDSGEKITVNYTAQNIGVESGNVTFELLIDGKVYDSEERTVDSNQGVTGELEIEDTGQFDGKVVEWVVQTSTEHTYQTGETGVGVKPELTFTDIKSNEPIFPNETLELTYTIENKGSIGSGEANVTLKTAKAGVVSTEEVQIKAGSQKDVTLLFDSVDNYYGFNEKFETKAVADGYDTYTNQISLNPKLGIKSINAPEKVGIENDDLSINYTIKNRGNKTDSATVELRTEEIGGVIDSQNVTVNTGDTKTNTLKLENVNKYYKIASEVNWTVSITDQKIQDETIYVEETTPGGYGKIIGVDVPNKSPVNEVVQAKVKMKNIGNDDHTDVLDFWLTEVQDKEPLFTIIGISPGETQEVPFFFEPGAEGYDEGDKIDWYTESLASCVNSDDGPKDPCLEHDSGKIEVTEANTPNHVIVDSNIEEPVTEGENVTANVTVRNTGEVAGEEEVQFELFNLGKDTESVELGVDKETTVTLSIPTEMQDNGTYTGVISTPNQAVDTLAVEVLEDTDLILNSADVEQDTIDFGNSTSVIANITNTRDTELTSNITLEVGQNIKTKEIKFEPNNTRAVTFELDTWEENIREGNYEGAVALSGEDTKNTFSFNVEIAVPTYANENGVVDEEGLLDAIGDYREDKINTILLIDVIEAYRAGNKVV